MSMDNRNTSALFKRAEQLKRWEESETNKHSGTPKSPSMRRIKFSSGCIFLAACVAGDKDEVSRLLETGADIDTANVDGLTALHQACIDDNLDMVEFLVQNGADVNRKDNEGWTPLHATSSCGFLSIARYLIESGADLASINSDGELALDLACSDAMEDLIQRHIDEQGIDCEDARQAEEKIMLNDAKRWLRSDSTDCDKPHPKTGATACHVAAAKGYGKVLALLLDGRGDFDKQDVDGWTPLHAAAYWGQKEAVQMLLNANVDIDVQNYSGQYAIDIAQKDIVPLLDEARKNNLKRPKRRPASQIRYGGGMRITDTIENSIETPTKVIRVEVKPIDSKEKEVPEKENQPTEPDVILRRTQSFESDEKFYQKYVELRARIQANSCPILPNTNPAVANAAAKTAASNNYLVQRSASLKDHRTLRKATSNLVLGSTGSTTTTGTNANVQTQSATSPPTSPTGTPVTAPSSGQIRSITPANNNNNINNLSQNNSHHIATPAEQTIDNNYSSSDTSDTSTTTNAAVAAAAAAGNKNHSLFELNRKYIEQAQKTKINNERNKFLSSLNEKRQQQLQQQQQQQQHQDKDTAAYQRAETKASPAGFVAQPATAESGPAADEPTAEPPITRAQSVGGVYAANAATATSPSSAVQNQYPAVVTSTNKLSPGNIFKNFFKSFVPPTRDEESETQRKAHAKRVRETRRSTQGVTLDEIKSAEQLVKKKNSTNAAEGDPAATTTTTITPPTSSSSSSTPAAVPTPPPPVNDRVPDPSGGTGSSSSSIPEVSSKQAPSPSDPPVSVSASFTLSAPPSTTANSKSAAAQRTGDGGGGGSGEGGGGDGTADDGSKISVSYTIAAPKGSESSVAATIGSAAKEKSKDDAVSTTATFSVPTPAANNLNKKTESDEFTKPTATIRAPASSFSTSKRSLFDIDNANSLTLAEKLRQEANKYAESDKENFVSSAKSSAKTSSETTAAAAAPANVTPAAAAEGTVLLRKDSSAPSSPLHQHHHQPSTLAERRPSWRLKVDGGSKFKLEDATAPAITPTSISSNNNTSSSTALDSSNNTRTQQNELNSISASSLAQRRQNGDSSTFNSTRPASAPELATTTTATSNDASLHLRRSLKSEENKENDKENDNRSSAQATQAVIQRRRRPKRRSTGVVHVDMEDIDPERQDSPVDGEEKESGAERGRSRVGSTASDLAADAQKDGSGVAESKENGGDYVDYKALYEQAKADNEKLKSSMRKKDEEVLSLKSALDRFTTATTKNNSLSELEKRERRAMERKMSEMEEELKLLQKYKTENERLRAENRALTRVVSKLTTSAQNQLHSKH
ncbi:protein phosphatase 1 regulatory subunit 12A isoform X11 [Culex pipiens pallens]|uniref:protein phosphatase 1 regulatory subunit 12A isoform X11 n=1 Tax=Culex pipiens pallens TaxID=42434 RepID=UPI001952D664|nr:protein phosphatase 1 regulatory subunit 12A isoform X11 [Culex pipiens pallens]